MVYLTDFLSLTMFNHSVYDLLINEITTDYAKDIIKERYICIINDANVATLVANSLNILVQPMTNPTSINIEIDILVVAQCNGSKVKFFQVVPTPRRNCG